MIHLKNLIILLFKVAENCEKYFREQEEMANNTLMEEAFSGANNRNRMSSKEW